MPFKVEPVTKDFANGKPFVRLLDDASGMAYYPSGRIALVVTTTARGFVQQAFDDNKQRSLLCTFNEVGVGSVLFGRMSQTGSAGRPRFVCTKHGGQFCNERGDITHEWAWEAPVGAKTWKCKIPDPWTYKLNGFMTFRGTSRQDLLLTLSGGSQNVEFAVGEVLKRKESYLQRPSYRGRVAFGPMRGSAILDIGAKTSTYRATQSHQGESSSTVSNSAPRGAKTLGSSELTESLEKLSSWQRSARRGDFMVMPFVETPKVDLLRQTVPNPLRDVGGPQPTTVPVVKFDQLLGEDRNRK